MHFSKRSTLEGRLKLDPKVSLKDGEGGIKEVRLGDSEERLIIGVPVVAKVAELVLNAEVAENTSKGLLLSFLAEFRQDRVTLRGILHLTLVLLRGLWMMSTIVIIYKRSAMVLLLILIPAGADCIMQSKEILD